MTQVLAPPDQETARDHRLGPLAQRAAAEPRDGFDPAGLSEAVRAALARQGAQGPQLAVEPVGAMPRTANGKAPLIRAPRR
jgi:hypothetical protein